MSATPMNHSCPITSLISCVSPSMQRPNGPMMLSAPPPLAHTKPLEVLVRVSQATCESSAPPWLQVRRTLENPSTYFSPFLLFLPGLRQHTLPNEPLGCLTLQDFSINDRIIFRAFGPVLASHTVPKAFLKHSATSDRRQTRFNPMRRQRGNPCAMCSTNSREMHESEDLIADLTVDS